MAPVIPIGLGCMRLSTLPERDDDAAIATLHAALDAGATLLDTANVYCHDDGDIGHNERLIATALARWRGDRSAITIATKGGLTRPGGAWVPDGRAKALRSACEASCSALGVEQIDLYQLHAPTQGFRSSPACAPWQSCSRTGSSARSVSATSAWLRSRQRAK